MEGDRTAEMESATLVVLSPGADLPVHGIRSRITALGPRFHAEQVIPPLRAAVAHKFTWLPPIRVRKQQHGFILSRRQLEAERRSLPLIGPLNAGPLHAFRRGCLHNVHDGRRFRLSPEVELQRTALLRISSHVICPPCGETVSCRQRVIYAFRRRLHTHTVTYFCHAI